MSVLGQSLDWVRVWELEIWRPAVGHNATRALQRAVPTSAEPHAFVGGFPEGTVSEIVMSTVMSL
eukprot:2188432-Alexandrium_andersonii.AAC.1